MEVAQHRPVVSRTTVEVDTQIETKEFVRGKPVAYKATEPVYLSDSGTLFKAGETFVTDLPKGSTWDEVNPKEKAAADAGKEIKGDVDLDALDVPSLKALAATKGINLGDAKSKADIITVIKAADAPAL